MELKYPLDSEMCVKFNIALFECSSLYLRTRSERTSSIQYFEIANQAIKRKIYMIDERCLNMMNVLRVRPRKYTINIHSNLYYHCSNFNFEKSRIEHSIGTF